MDCMESVVESFFGGGVAHAHEMHDGLLKKYSGEYGETATEEDAQFLAEKEKAGEEEAVRLRDERQRQETLNHLAFPLPLWQQLSGLYPEDEKWMHPNERAGRIAKLLRNVERMMRWEMKNGGTALKIENLKGGDQRDEAPGCGGGDAGETGLRAPSTLIRRMFSWDPLRTVCFKLDISAAQLSRYMREITGMSVRELVDCIRMETARGRMKEELRDFVRKERARGTDAPGAQARNPADCATVAEEIFEALKKFRRAPRWHRTAWAAEMGFSSYQKFFRACLLMYGVTPHQVEMELIDEILSEEAGVEESVKQVSLPPATDLDLEKTPEGEEREAG